MTRTRRYRSPTLIWEGPDNDREQQQDAGEARVQLLIAKTLERYERRRRRQAKE